MIAKLSSIALLAAITSAANAQTTTTPKATSATATHTAAATKTATTPPNIPKVVGIPKTLYAIKYIDIKIGTGPLAADRKYYTVHYTGWLTNGTKFDSSYDHPGAEPITFPYGGHRVIPGWDTGFQGMHVGGKRRLFIPYQLAYGESGRPPVIPAKADLIFDLELVSQSDTPPQPKTPPAAPAAPASPQKTTPATPTTPTTPTAPTTPTTPTTPSTPTTPTTPTTNPPHPEGL